MNRIPTNLITGFLGVGKTTAILDLLKAKDPSARWAVIVNEYGEVGIDGAILSDADHVEIREVSGGCMCCTSVVEFRFTLAQVIEFAKPDRILIETTGVGHPAKILDDLRSPEFADRIEVLATLGILAPADFTCPPMFESPVFRDQIELADVLVLNKADQIDQSIRDKFMSWSKDLFPPKLHVAITEQGKLDPAWLDLGANSERKAIFPDAHSEEKHQHRDEIQLAYPTPGKPIRKESRGPGGKACGWIFSAADVFDEDRLMQVLSQNTAILRLKGVFQTEAGWVIINRSGRETVTWPTNYRRDSRLEAFATDIPGGWSKMESDLVDCLQKLT